MCAATESLVAAYEFTTLTCIPGNIMYRGTKIQLLDLPGIIEGERPPEPFSAPVLYPTPCAPPIRLRFRWNGALCLLLAVPRGGIRARLLRIRCWWLVLRWQVLLTVRVAAVRSSLSQNPVTWWSWSWMLARRRTTVTGTLAHLCLHPIRRRAHVPAMQAHPGA